MNKLLITLFNKFYGERIIELFTLIGSDGGQNGENDVYNTKNNLHKTRYPYWPNQSSKSKIVTVYMKVQIVQVA